MLSLWCKIPGTKCNSILPMFRKWRRRYRTQLPGAQVWLPQTIIPSPRLPAIGNVEESVLNRDWTQSCNMHNLRVSAVLFRSVLKLSPTEALGFTWSLEACIGLCSDNLETERQVKMDWSLPGNRQLFMEPWLPTGQDWGSLATRQTHLPLIQLGRHIALLSLPAVVLALPAGLNAWLRPSVMAWLLLSFWSGNSRFLTTCFPALAHGCV